jgi:hypothetical protein
VFADHCAEDLDHALGFRFAGRDSEELLRDLWQNRPGVCAELGPLSPLGEIIFQVLRERNFRARDVTQVWHRRLAMRESELTLLRGACGKTVCFKTMIGFTRQLGPLAVGLAPGEVEVHLELASCCVNPFGDEVTVAPFSCVKVAVVIGSTIKLVDIRRGTLELCEWLRTVGATLTGPRLAALAQRRRAVL